MSEEEYRRRIRVLNEIVWEGRVREPDVNRWLENFNGEVFDREKEHRLALILLAHFNYFGDRELRELLRAMYRDLFRYPIVQTVLGRLGRDKPKEDIDKAVLAEIAGTRFIGMGNPSESGSHLLYYFRQESRINKHLFVHQHEILSSLRNENEAQLAISGLKRLVFIDDVLGSGQQAVEYSAKTVSLFKQVAARQGIDLEVVYLVLFARRSGLEVARATDFSRVDAVHVMDDSEAAFSSDSRLGPSLPADVQLNELKRLAAHYGEKLFPGHGLGYRSGQMMLGFHHNIPDNTLPIFWFDDDGGNWDALLPRYPKEVPFA